MDRHCTCQRLIAAILVVFVLGLQCMSVLSTSHTRMAHRHADHSQSVGTAQADHGHHQLATKAKEARAHVHSHQHDPSDHTHDFPLRLVLAVVQFSFLPIWHTEAALPFRSVVVHPLERPPKPAVLA
ncbi:hypothetical protein [Massilia niastensis]|uniref:hypothetical protein n=1 Tax=Massilia niastensis TaxID=544911 RepID=UPI00037295B8|nr:hypothetical protein [Massilia niastensis]